MRTDLAEGFFPDEPRGVLHRLADIIRLEVGIILQDLFSGLACGEKIQDQMNWNPQASDARSAAKLVRIGRDAAEGLHGRTVTQRARGYQPACHFA
jgi:hypothetical protein